MVKKNSITLHGEAANSFVQTLLKEKEKGCPGDILDTLFGMSVIGMWESGTYIQIRDRLERILTYLEDGATETAKEILRQLLRRSE